MEPILSVPLLSALLATCAPQVHPTTAQALVTTESSTHPFAIGVVGGQLQRQPRSLEEAVTTAERLRSDGWNFSVGLAQINLRNLASLGLSLRDAFDPCRNLTAMQSLLADCFRRASERAGADDAPSPSYDSQFSQAALRDALSCYYSGNFVTGRRHGYVARVVRASSRTSLRTSIPTSLTVAQRPP